jgi:hypothetical protein
MKSARIRAALTVSRRADGVIAVHFGEKPRQNA